MSGDKRGYISVAVAILLFAVASLLCLNAIFTRGMRAKGDARRYELNVIERNGRGSVLLCYTGGRGYTYHFLLNAMQSAYSEIHIEKGTAINTKLPVQCVKYPFETFEVEPRLRSTPRRRRGEERFVFIGDSFTFGEGVPLENSFPRTFEMLLRSNGRKNASVLNFGRAGITFPRIYAVNFKAALKAAPDHIVYVWTPGNIPERPDGAPAVAGVNDEAYTREFHDGRSAPFQRLIKNITAEKRMKARIVSEFAAAYRPRSGNPQQLRKYFRLMNSEARAAGATFDVVLYPRLICDYREYPFRNIHSVVATILESEHIRAIDLSGALLSRCSEKLWAHPADRHPSALANYHAAAELAAGPGAFHTRIKTAPRRAARLSAPASAAAPPDYPRRAPGFAPLFFFVSLLLLLLLVSVAANAAIIGRELLKENTARLLLLVLIVVSAYALREYFSPHIHQTFNDEFDRINIIRLWIAGAFNTNAADNIPGSMLPFFIAHKIFGPGPEVEYQLAVCFSVATALMLYASARVSGLGGAAAIAAALLFAVCPPSVRFAASQNIDTLNAFFMALCWFAVMYDLRYGGFRARLLMVSSFAFALFVRIDNTVVIALMALFRAAAPKSDNPSPSGAGASTSISPAGNVFSGAVLLSALVVWAVYAVVCIRNTAQFSHVSSVGRNAGVNLDGNLAFFFNNAAFPVAFTLAAGLGVILSEARKKTGDGVLRVVRFQEMWFLSVFIIQLASAAGGYDYHLFKDTTRYVIDLLPPLLTLAAVGVCAVYNRLPGGVLKSAAVAVAAAYMLFAIPLFSDFINDKSRFTRINEALLETIVKYEPDATFVTNSDLVYNVIALDAGRRAAFTQDAAKAGSLCNKGRDCVFILYRGNRMRELDGLDIDCTDRFLVEDVSILFFPIREIRKVPAGFLKAPDSTPPTGAPPKK